MKIWSNTSTLKGFDSGLNFTRLKEDAEIALIGSKPIDITKFKKLKGIFRAGIGKDNVPELQANIAGVSIQYPSQKTIDLIFEETASFTCSLIFRMLYSNVGNIERWEKRPRKQFSAYNLLIIGNGNIGSRVSNLMNPFLRVKVFDYVQNKPSDLKNLINNADCISLHIPKNNENLGFINKEKLSWMKNGSILINSSRGALVEENALLKN